jgi:hypothetical protein
LRKSSNPKLNFLARSTGILTTYLGKMLGIQGWRDYHLDGTVDGEVTHAAGSSDFLYTIDLQIKQMSVQGRTIDLGESAKFLRVEVLPFVRVGAPLPVQDKEEICVSGKVVWDGDGFLEIHPRHAKYIVPCRDGQPRRR